MKNRLNDRLISVAVCSLLFAYLLSFVFEGKVFYSLLAYFGTPGSRYILGAIAAHFAGLVTCGVFVRSQKAARAVMPVAMGVCLALSLPFFFAPGPLWPVCLAAAGFFGGWAFASWGWFLKACTPKALRLRSCADVLIASNVLMICINVVAVNASAPCGLGLSLACLGAGAVLARRLPEEGGAGREGEGPSTAGLKKPLVVLFVFVAVITINSGLMYQVINPAFAHLPALVSWYWAVPYILALAAVRRLPPGGKRAGLLYGAMAMIMAAFICFMLLGRGWADYLVVDTLMLGACGIFDLFWWSIIGEMLEYADNPALVSGIGLSANVFGVLCGDVLGIWMGAVSLPGAQITVIALCVVCVTLALLPALNAQLVLLLKSNAYLWAYKAMAPERQARVPGQKKALAPLTEREQEVLEQVLSGKGNREIAALLYISENTVKTHIRNIYSKYAVASRAELISALLKNQSEG